MAAFRQLSGNPVYIIFPGLKPGKIYGKVVRIHPKAAPAVPDLALAAAVGGPLPVRQISAVADSTADKTSL